MISRIILPSSFLLFFHSFPQASSVNKEKKNNCRKVYVFVFMCVCTENLDTSLFINHPISAAGLTMCPCTKVIVIITVNRRM